MRNTFVEGVELGGFVIAPVPVDPSLDGTVRNPANSVRCGQEGCSTKYENNELHLGRDVKIGREDVNRL